MPRAQVEALEQYDILVKPSNQLAVPKKRQVKLTEKVKIKKRVRVSCCFIFCNLKKGKTVMV